jgi:hypothetical protein
MTAALSKDNDETCECFSCDTTRGTAEVEMYTKATADGIGSVATHAVNAMAIASKLNWRYKGAYGGLNGKAMRLHVAQEKVAMDFLFGNYSQVRPTYPAPNGLVVDLNAVNGGVRPWKDTTKALNKDVLLEWANTLPSFSDRPLSKVYVFNDVNYDAVPCTLAQIFLLALSLMCNHLTLVTGVRLPLLRLLTTSTSSSTRRSLLMFNEAPCVVFSESLHVPEWPRFR